MIKMTAKNTMTLNGWTLSQSGVWFPHPLHRQLTPWCWQFISDKNHRNELFMATNSLNIVGAFDEPVRDIQRIFIIFIFAHFFFQFWIDSLWLIFTSREYLSYLAFIVRSLLSRVSDRISYNIAVIVVYVPDSVGSLRSIVNIVLESWWRANKHIHFTWPSSLLWLS